MDENLLLTTDFARELYHGTVSGLPIIDYHNHLAPVGLAAEFRFHDLAELWIAADPYKHRAMRICGVPEKLITGDADAKTKFLTWARVLPKTVGGPLYPWSRMELATAFGIKESLNAENAETIWERCSEQMADFSPMGFLKHCNTETICPCAEILDDLSRFRDAEGIRVVPSLRGDSMLRFDNLSAMLAGFGSGIESFDAYKAAVAERLTAFDEVGCVLADHSLDDGFHFVFPEQCEGDRLFEQALDGKALSAEELLTLQTAMMIFLGKTYAKMRWILQLHMGAQRHTSSRLRSLVGPAGGFATAGEPVPVGSLTKYLDCLERDGALPKTILFTLNPAHLEHLAILTGSFAEDGVQGKVQCGPAWWFNDHYGGIRRHLEAVANYGVLGTFIGMTTDSRTVLSFSRHAYFRRILCATLGEWAEKQIIPDDAALLCNLVADISYNNVKTYLIKDGQNE